MFKFPSSLCHCLLEHAITLHSLRRWLFCWRAWCWIRKWLHKGNREEKERKLSWLVFTALPLMNLAARAQPPQKKPVRVATPKHKASKRGPGCPHTKKKIEKKGGGGWVKFYMAWVEKEEWNFYKWKLSCFLHESRNININIYVW